MPRRSRRRKFLIQALVAALLCLGCLWIGLAGMFVDGVVVYTADVNDYRGQTWLVVWAIASLAFAIWTAMAWGRYRRRVRRKKRHIYRRKLKEKTGV